MEGPVIPPPPPTRSPRSNFRQFFFRGLAIVLPTVLTIWILVAVYQFVEVRIARPINEGMRAVVLRTTPYPVVTEQEVLDYEQEIQTNSALREERVALRELRLRNPASAKNWLRFQARELKLQRQWAQFGVLLDLIGLAVAIALIYIIGVLVGSFIGRRLYQRGERMIHRVPLVSKVYPSVKQVTDFLVGSDQDRLQFNRVVALEYPRRGMWSVGLVTGETMREIHVEAGAECLTVFIPSSPTPFTGYVVTVLRSEAIDLDITLEDAMKFAVSGGVLIPPHQKINAPQEMPAQVPPETPPPTAGNGSPAGGAARMSPTDQVPDKSGGGATLGNP